MPVVVTKDNFKEEVLDAEGLVMVDFWAAWCAPCRALSPILELLDSQHGDKVKVAKLNVDENPALAQQYGITGIPNVKFFKDGKVVEDVVGLAPKPYYEDVIKAHI